MESVVESNNRAWSRQTAGVQKDGFQQQQQEVLVSCSEEQVPWEEALGRLVAGTLCPLPLDEAQWWQEHSSLRDLEATDPHFLNRWRRCSESWTDRHQGRCTWTSQSACCNGSVCCRRPDKLRTFCEDGLYLSRRTVKTDCGWEALTLNAGGPGGPVKPAQKQKSTFLLNAAQKWFTSSGSKLKHSIHGIQQMCLIIIIYWLLHKWNYLFLYLPQNCSIIQYSISSLWQFC